MKPLLKIYIQLLQDWGLSDMNKSELEGKVQIVKNETQEALQTMYDALNQGQQKKIIKNEKVKKLFDRYGVKYESEN